MLSWRLRSNKSKTKLRVKEEELRELFGAKGHITDCTLKFTQDGVFRKFAFIGYQNESEATQAVKYFDKSFIRTSRIKVELASGIGEQSKPRAWSKYSSDSSAFKKQQQSGDGGKNKKNTKEEKNQQKKIDKETKKKKKQDKIDELLGDVKNDPEFEEFLQVHKARVNKTTWSNDEVLAVTDGDKVKDQSNVMPDKQSKGKEIGQLFDDEDDGSIDSENSRGDESLPAVSPQKVYDKEQSDMDFLKSKMTDNKQLFSDSDSSDSDTSGDEGENTTEEDGSSHSDGKHTNDIVNSESGFQSDSSEDEDSEQVKEEGEGQIEGQGQKEGEDGGSGEITRYIIKMRGLTSNVKESQIHEFFKPIQPTSVKIPRNAKGNKVFCIATVEFSTESDQESAMRRNKNFIGPKRIFLHKSKVTEKTTDKPAIRPWEVKLAQQSEETEGIAESGRLYVRNLAYMCKEEDLEQKFSQYGPLSEVHLPIDSFTKKIKGFAFITYMIPEHAVQAFTELDGKIFQGRIFHILPAQPKKEDYLQITDDMSYKKKKELQQKAQAVSSHNWNSLFLGANAVADVMAQKYGKSKSAILDADQKQSLGVRMALGETQIVSETRDFLIDNGVVLDSFSQAGGPRSKSCVLVKNLPAGTQPKELISVFDKFGELGRVVLPPSGVTAVIEFIEEAEAKQAFRNLAYTKFKHIPLYLEWAPMGVFKDTRRKEGKDDVETMDTTTTKEEDDKSEDSSDEDLPEPDTTLFLKNLNFETTEDSIKEHFRKCGPIHSVTVARKKDLKHPGQFLSMGYGFVQYKKKSSAQKALKQLQHSSIDSHQVEIKLSNRAVIGKDAKVSKKRQDPKRKQTTSKILVRNIPFEAKEREVRELFSVFGELKTVRLPKKLSGTGSHRGFAFVDFVSKQDAKRSFNALCHSTHLYGRRLVLEWADTEETVDQLRKKTAQHFHEEPVAKKLKKSALKDTLLGTKL